MGGKQQLLDSGLGEILLRVTLHATRFVDIMAGSAVVSHYVATRMPITVWANDLQHYSKVLAGAVLGRVETLDVGFLKIMADEAVCSEGFGWTSSDSLTVERVLEARDFCRDLRHDGFFSRHYGGYYYSPAQAIAFDRLHGTLPDEDGEERTLAQASLVIAASKCAAAPGHTAQPFRPKDSLLAYIAESWRRDPVEEFLTAGRKLAGMYCHVPGMATVSDASAVVREIESTDVVFVDPPYSEGHYSRFYHVLEAVARGGYSEVSGAGRMPSPAERARSDFSRVGKSMEAVSCLLRGIASKGATAVMTFPAGECSNGLSGQIVLELARRWFHVEDEVLPITHSTLGGGRNARGSRRHVAEIVLVMRPKSL